MDPECSQGTFASKVEFQDGAEGKVHVTREIDGGLETVALLLPAVVTCDLRLNDPRFATLSNIMKSRKKKVETIDVADLGVDIEPRLEILEVRPPEQRKAGIFVDSVEQLVDKLRLEAKVL